MTNETKHSQAFEDWLDEATRGLCDIARERIRVETEAHYLDAYEDGLAQGLDVEAAHTQALFGLGASAAAEQRFRKVDLTSKEMEQFDSIKSDLQKTVQQKEPIYSWGFTSIFFVLFVVFIVCWMVSGFSLAYLLNFYVLAFLIIMAVEYGKFYVYKKKKSAFLLWQFIFLSMANWLIVVLFGLDLYGSLLGGIQPGLLLDLGIFVIAIVYSCYSTIKYIRLFLKVNRASTEEEPFSFRM